MSDIKQKVCPCGDLFLCAKDGIYNNTIFKQFFEENDPAVIGWAENVLRKLEGTGILPTFINKTENEDFRALWGTITHLFAIIVLYARKYNEIATNEILFQIFVTNRGLVNDLVTSQEEMEYLFNNYTKEFTKRGRKDILAKEGEILGELLRLIRYNSLDEFIFVQLQPENTGWCMSWSSPTWQRTERIQNITKAYEYGESVESLSNYPLLRSLNINLTQDENDPNEPIFNAMTFFGTQSVGIDGREDLDKLIIVDPNLSYEISAQIKVSGLSNENIKFGVVGYEDVSGNPVNLAYLDKGEIDRFVYNFEDWSVSPSNGIIEVTSLSEFNWIKQLIADKLVLSTLSNVGDVFKIEVEISGIDQDRKVWFGNPGQASTAVSCHNGLNVIEFTSNGTEVGFGSSTIGDCDITIKQVAYNRSTWFHTDEYLQLPTEGIYYNIKGILLSYNERYYDPPKLNFISGRALSLTPNIKYIAPILIQERSSQITGQPYVFVYDFKVKPLRLPFQQGYLGKKDIIAAYYKNNAYQSQFVTEEFMKTYLVNYKNVIGSEVLVQQDETEIYTALFKVFSDRNRYIQSATLTINEQTYKTDVNGEVLIKLPKGIWYYKVEADNFDTVESTFELTKDEVIYTQMKGTTYERVVTFIVKDKDSKIPIPNAKVTFGDKVNYTSSNGLVSFDVFPGTYKYVVEYTDYYTVQKNVEISDNTYIEVELEAIPYYNVTFRVRNGVDPVSGVAIVVTGETISEQTGSTNNQGLATGFVLAAGTYHYLASKQEWEGKEDDFTIYGNAIIDIQLQSIPKYNVTFQVMNNNLPVIGANVTFNGVTLQTISDGTATFSEIDGVYDWQVNKNEFYSQSGKLTVAGASIIKELNLIQIEYNINFSIKDDEGQPIEMAKVSIGTQTQYTDVQGKVSFQRISGSYNYTITRDFYYLIQGVAVVSSGDQMIDITMKPISYNVVFTVQINGQVVPNQLVQLGTETQQTDSKGVVIFDRSPGEYEWEISRDTFETQSGKVVVIDRQVFVMVDLQKTKGDLYVIVKETDTQGQAINGAIITINGENKETDTQGQAGPWSLILGSWIWRANANGYKENTGNVQVREGNNNLIISLAKEDQIQHVVLFSCTENGVPLAGVNIELSNGTVLTTNEAGQVQTSLVQDKYTYVITYGPYFDKIEGSLNVTSDLTIPIALVRKTTSVQIRVVNALDSTSVSGATVLFYGKQATSNNVGLATFNNIPLSDNSIRCSVTKEPQFEETFDYFTVREQNPEFTMILGASTYSVVFTVKDFNGANVSGVAVQMNSITQYTDSQGKAVFVNLSPNRYSWQIFKTNYISQTGSVLVINENVYQNIVLDVNKAYVTYHVQYADGSSVQGIQIGDNVSTGITDVEGNVSWYVPVGKTYTWRATSNDYFSENGSYTVESDDVIKNIIITLRDAAAIELTIQDETDITLPIINSALNGLNDLRVDWGDGKETYGKKEHTYTNAGVYRVRFNFNGEIYNLSWSCSLAGNINPYLTRVLRWFNSEIETTFYIGAFKDCQKLIMIPSFKTSLCSGSAQAMCSGCSSLTQFPDFNLSWADNDLSEIFMNSGLVGSVNLSNIFSGLLNITSYKEAFANTNITNITGILNPSSGGCDISGIFRSCTSLQYISSNMNAINITDCSYMTYQCINLKNVCTITAKNDTPFNAIYAFANTSIVLLPSQMLLGNPTTADLSYFCSNCEKLQNIYTDAISLDSIGIRMDYAFNNTTSLYDISGTKIRNGISFVGTYTYSGVTSIPNGFFNESTGATDFATCFSNCYNLRQVGMNLFGKNAVIMRLSGFLQYCTALTSVSVDTLLSESRDSIQEGPIFSCIDYSYFFRGCLNLVTGLLIHGFLKEGSLAYIDLYIYEWEQIKVANGWKEPETPAGINGTGCYNGCVNMVGYMDVPTDWK